MAKKQLAFDSIVEKGEEYWENIFIEQFISESDRGAVLISLSYIEELLEVLLKRMLVPLDRQQKDKLFDLPNSPIGTLSSKISLSYRLGLISEEFQTVLDKLREIRNEFAHSFISCTFKEKSVKDKVNNLYSRFKKLHQFEKHNFARFGDDARGKYLIIVNWLTFKLIQSIMRTDCLKQKPIEFAFWDKGLEHFFVSLPELKDDKELNEIYRSLIDKRKKTI